MSTERSHQDGLLLDQQPLHAQIDSEISTLFAEPYTNRIIARISRETG